MSGSTVSSRSSSSTSSRRYSNSTPASSVTSSGRPRGYRGGGHEIARSAAVEQVREDGHEEDSEGEDLNEGENEEDEDEEGEESEDEDEDDEDKKKVRSSSRTQRVSSFSFMTNFGVNTGMHILIINDRPDLLDEEEEEEGEEEEGEEEVLPIAHQQVPLEDPTTHRESMGGEREAREARKARRVNAEEKPKRKMEKDRDFGEK
ncbi:hypothetical protein ACHAPG_004340 [Botrytis cinerea]